MNEWFCTWTLDEENNVYDVGCVDNKDMCFSYVPKRCPVCGLRIIVLDIEEGEGDTYA